MATKNTKKTNSKKQVSKPSNALVFALAFIVVAVLIVTLAYIIPGISHKTRENKIRAVFSSLELDDTYLKQKEFIYGDKRANGLNGDKDKSAYTTYVRGANVDETAADLRQRIEAAGFDFEKDNNPSGSILHYTFNKDKTGKIYTSVSSKLLNDALQNASLMGLSAETVGINSNLGPSEITIRVDIDAKK